LVTGFNSFREWFQGYETNYTIIGGTACDLLMSEAGVDFRATKDVDMVLIVEAINTDFGLRFWEYVKAAGYEQRLKSSGKPEFYRFVKPKDLLMNNLTESLRQHYQNSNFHQVKQSS